MWQNFTIANFRGDALKNQLWKIARRTTVDTWEEARKEMEAMNKKAFQWLDNLPPNTWVRAFQNDFSKCDILLNNNSEVFNK